MDEMDKIGSNAIVMSRIGKPISRSACGNQEIATPSLTRHYSSFLSIFPGSPKYTLSFLRYNQYSGT